MVYPPYTQGVLMRGMVIKLYPNKVQKQRIQEHIDICRFTYNKSLAIRKEAYEQHKSTIGKFKLITMIKELKHIEEFSWVNNASAQTVQQSILNLDKAYTNFFRRVKQGTVAPGFPRFKSRKNPLQSFQYAQYTKINDCHSKLYLPKIGWVKCGGYRDDFIGDIKTVTIKKWSGGTITATILVDYVPKIRASRSKKTIGIDIGTNKLAIDSEGTMFPPLDLSKEVSSMKRLQRSLAAIVDSAKDRQNVTTYQDIVPFNNMVRTQAAIAKLFRKITNKRDNYIHHVANHYLSYKLVYVEDLNIKQMMKSTVGTEDNPNYQSRQDKRLHNLIANQAWGKFFTILEYKLLRLKSMLVKVPPEYTSQTCNKCCIIDPKSKHKEHFRCTSCGHTDDADINAAKDIRHIGSTRVLQLVA